MISGNHFTLAYVFGKHIKLGQTKINFRVDCKITLPSRKWILVSILPSNEFQDLETKREREEESKKKEHRWFAQHEFRHQSPIPYHRPAKLWHKHPSSIPHHLPAKLQHKHPSLIPYLSPPLPHHRSTNTQDPPLRSLAMHRQVRVELRSWQPTVCRAPTLPPSRSEPCILFSSSPPKTNLVAATEDRSLFPSIS